jgi:F0F1-type ATP synthase membrane subunit a
MGIEMLIGAIQAYIFTALAMVFIGNEGRPVESRERTES